MSLHAIQVHPEPIEDCFGCKAATIQLGAGTVTTTKGGQEAAFSRKFEANLEKDRPAYKAMRDQGLRPAKMFGADKMMNEARTKFEIESGKLMKDVPAGTIDRAVQEAEGALGHSLKKSSAVAL